MISCTQGSTDGELVKTQRFYLLNDTVIGEGVVGFVDVFDSIFYLFVDSNN